MNRLKFKVGIRKSYYPRERTAPDALYVETFNIVATNRTEAAGLVWREHGDRILREITPGAERVTLDVTPGNLGGLSSWPITVWIAPELR